MEAYDCFFFYNRYLVRTVVRSHHKKDQITQALKLYQGRKVVKKSSASAFNPGSVCICRGPFLHKWAQTPVPVQTVSLSLSLSFSLSLPLRQLMTTAQQQHCLISSVFLNLGCQGSLVGGCLLYFPYKKKKSCCLPI